MHLSHTHTRVCVIFKDSQGHCMDAWCLEFVSQPTIFLGNFFGYVWEHGYGCVCVPKNFEIFNMVCMFWIVLMCWCQKWFLKNKKNIIGMHFDTKSYLKSTRNHITKHAIPFTCKLRSGHEILVPSLFFLVIHEILVLVFYLIA